MTRVAVVTCDWDGQYVVGYIETDDVELATTRIAQTMCDTLNEMG